MYAYKKLTAQDVAVVPFNAHKQYDFDSASCSTNRINHYNTQWTSESISLYTSTSAVYGGDVKNILKYASQIYVKKQCYIKTGDFVKNISRC